MRFLFISSLLGVLLMSPMASASSLVSDQTLSFGILVPLASSGSAIVSFGGVIAPTNAYAAPGSAATNGIMTFTATGLSGLLDIQFTPSAPASVTLNNSTSGGGSVTISNFTFTPNLLIKILSPVTSFSVGGTMKFTSTSLPGTYQGVVPITIPSLLGILGSATVGNLNLRVVLWRALSANEQAELNFGTIQVSNQASVVRIAPQTSARSVVSGTATLDSSGSTAVAGQFAVTGQVSTPVSISFPASATLSSASGSVTVSNFVKYPAGATQTLDASGAATFYVGADLTVSASQPAGAYTGTYIVTINY